MGGCLVTARIRSMTGRYCFHRCLSVNISGGGTWSQIFGGGVPGLRFSGGVPGLRFSGGGTWSQIFRGGYLVSDFRGGGTRSMATRRAVCLLRSRRRTFLFSHNFMPANCPPIPDYCHLLIPVKCVTRWLSSKNNVILPWKPFWWWWSIPAGRGKMKDNSICNLNKYVFVMMVNLSWWEQKTHHHHDVVIKRFCWIYFALPHIRVQSHYSESESQTLLAMSLQNGLQPILEWLVFTSM